MSLTFFSRAFFTLTLFTFDDLNFLIFFFSASVRAFGSGVAVGSGVIVGSGETEGSGVTDGSVLPYESIRVV